MCACMALLLSPQRGFSGRRHAFLWEPMLSFSFAFVLHNGMPLRDRWSKGMTTLFVFLFDKLWHKRTEKKEWA